MADQDPVSREEFNTLSTNVTDLTAGVNSMLELMKKNNQPSATLTPAPDPREKEVATAGPNKYQQNPDWEEIAHQIIGEAVDHTEIAYAKGGGLLFTIVIKREFSNAPTDYLERYKEDRRTKEVGAEGESGVRIWCELVRDNLKRPKRVEM